MTTNPHSHSTRCWWDVTRAAWSCPTGVQTELAPERDLVDVRDMVVVHTALLREFRLLGEAVARTPLDDRAQASAVDRHLGLLCDLLHHHHEGEDALLWPVLRRRVPAAEALIDGAEDQHAGLAAALGRVKAARTPWTTGTHADSRDVLVAALERLHALLEEHLELEERTLLPLAAAALTPREWHSIGEAAVASMSKSLLPLVFGMFAYEGDPAVLRQMLASAPAVPRMVLPRVAPRVYARRAAAVYGTSRP